MSEVYLWYRALLDAGLRHGQAVSRIAQRLGVDYGTAVRVVKRAEQQMRTEIPELIGLP